MNFDSFLDYPRWEILKILSKKPASPTELAKELKTTMAYISQQLKILDAAGLISKTKTGASEKGKPRSVFELSNEVIYLAGLTRDFTGKKLIIGNDYHKNILLFWLAEDSSLHYYLEKLYWKLEENRNEIDSIFLEISPVKIIVVSDSKPLKSRIESYLDKFPKKINCTFISPNNFKKQDHMVPLYFKEEASEK